MTKLQQRGLTHEGVFSERVGGLFQIIMNETGSVDIGMGLGFHPQRSDICVFITLNNERFATAFTSKEAKALVEIIESTRATEEPPTQKLSDMLDYIVKGCNDLSAEIDELERAARERQLN